MCTVIRSYGSDLGKIIVVLAFYGTKAEFLILHSREPTIEVEEVAKRSKLYENCSRNNEFK